MFCDLVNSSALADGMDPEDFGAFIEAFRAACIVPIKRYQGVVARYLGDGILIYFGYPVAHEDDPDRAVRAGLEIVAAAEAMNRNYVGPERGRIAVRVGVHTGIVVVGDLHRQDIGETMAVFGNVPNLAARLQGLAAPNRIVVSEQTRSLLSSTIRCRSLGEMSVKGTAQPITLFEAVDAQGDPALERGAGRARMTLPFVNRRRELAELYDCAAAARDGQGNAVLLSGDPGIGKSRLIKAIREELTSEPCLWLSARASPYAVNSDFFAFAVLFRQILQPAEGDSTGPSGYVFLRQALDRQGWADKAMALGLATLLGLEIPAHERAGAAQPERMRELALSAVIRWLAGQAEAQPVVLVVEDLQWADASTLELIQRILADLDGRRILLILSSRDAAVIPGSIARLRRLDLEKLEPPDAHALLVHVLGGTELPPAAISTLLSRANGVPLFIVELPQSILEPGRSDGGKPGGAEEPITIPATLRDSLMARLDRLGPAKAVAQIGAVLGHAFDFDLMRLMWHGSEATLEQAIAELVDAALVIQWGVLPQAHFEFKHALIEEIAYDSLLHKDRRRYHLRAAKALAANFQELVQGRPELVARHYAAAGESAAAFDAWLKAGQTAARRSANKEAIGHMASAEEELAKLERAEGATPDGRRLSLLVARGPVLIALSGWAAPEVEQTYRAALTISESLGVEPAEQFDIWRGLYNVYLLRGDLNDARAATDRLREIAMDLSDHHEFVLSWHRSVGLCDFLAARFDASTEHLEAATRRFKPSQQDRETVVQGTNPIVIAYSITAWAQWFLGNSKKAAKASSAAIEAAQRAEHPFSLCYALCLASSLAQSRNRAAEALHLAEEALALSIEHAFPYWRAWADIVKGWAMAALDAPDAGLAMLQEGIARYEATGAAQMQSYSLCLLAEAYQRAGRWPDVKDAAEAAAAETERTGIVFYQSEAYRLLGEGLLRSGGEKSLPLRLLVRAMRTAEQQHSLPLLLRATCSLLRHSDSERLRATIMARATQMLADLEQTCPAPELDAARQRLAEAAATIGITNQA